MTTRQQLIENAGRRLYIQRKRGAEEFGQSIHLEDFEPGSSTVSEAIQNEVKRVEGGEEYFKNLSSVGWNRLTHAVAQEANEHLDRAESFQTA